MTGSCVKRVSPTCQITGNDGCAMFSMGFHGEGKWYFVMGDRHIQNAQDVWQTIRLHNMCFNSVKGNG